MVLADTTITCRALLKRGAECLQEVKCFVADLTVEADVEALLAFAGDISILVNNAGMAQTGVSTPGGGLLKDQTLDYWKRQL
jgi:NAD(P)-dependent dehydrogenase (short-subunit alcohol dehydrogenase family)